MPRIIVTTSRRPNRRIRSFVKELVETIPGSIKLTRGHLSMQDLAFEAQNLGADRVIIVADRRGNPGIMRVYKPEKNELVNIVSFIIKGVTLARERGIPLGIGKKHDKRKLFVKPITGEEIEYKFVDAFILAFHAKLYTAGVEGLISEIKAINERDVLVDFKFNDKPYGPKLKLGAPSRMIKV